MQVRTHKLPGSVRIYIAAALLLFGRLSVQGQSFQFSVVGTWEGIMYSNIPAANGAMVQCVFSLQGEYTCMVSKSGIGAVRHWGAYRILGDVIEMQIKGHEPESVPLPETDHMEIVSLTADRLTTRAFAEGVYAFVKFRRVQ